MAPLLGITAFSVQLTVVVVSSGPEILLFKRFKAAWPKIDQTKFNRATSSTQDKASDIVALAQDQLNKFQPRDDYKELLDLTITWEVSLQSEYHLKPPQDSIVLGGW